MQSKAMFFAVALRGGVRSDVWPVIGWIALVISPFPNLAMRLGCWRSTRQQPQEARLTAVACRLRASQLWYVIVTSCERR